VRPQLQINRSLRLPNNQHYPVAQKKTSIFLHHTAGNTAKGAITWWNQTPDHVGTAYVIDRDGTIYEAFDPKCWAYHLGIKGDDDSIEKNSVGIELVSCGKLHDVEHKFFFYPLFPSKLSAKEVESGDVYVADEEWRGIKNFHVYTEAQIASLRFTIEHIISEFKMVIPKVREDFYEYDENVITNDLPGIWSHSTVRKDKNDIFPYPPLLDMLKGLSL